MIANAMSISAIKKTQIAKDKVFAALLLVSRFFNSESPSVAKISSLVCSISSLVSSKASHDSFIPKNTYFLTFKDRTQSTAEQVISKMLKFTNQGCKYWNPLTISPNIIPLAVKRILALVSIVFLMSHSSENLLQARSSITSSNVSMNSVGNSDFINVNLKLKPVNNCKYLI